MEQNELKPCPFCGEEAYKDLKGNIVCHNCPVWISGFYEDATKLWNKRQSEPEWISVEDETPKDGKPVFARLKWFNSGKIIYAVLTHGDYDDHDWETADDRSEISHSLTVTHWMSPPNKGDE